MTEEKIDSNEVFEYLAKIKGALYNAPLAVSETRKILSQNEDLQAKLAA